MLLQTAIKVVY